MQTFSSFQAQIRLSFMMFSLALLTFFGMGGMAFANECGVDPDSVWYYRSQNVQQTMLTGSDLDNLDEAVQTVDLDNISLLGNFNYLMVRGISASCQWDTQVIHKVVRNGGSLEESDSSLYTRYVTNQDLLAWPGRNWVGAVEDTSGAGNSTISFAWSNLFVEDTDQDGFTRWYTYAIRYDTVATSEGDSISILSSSGLHPSDSTYLLQSLSNTWSASEESGHRYEYHFQILKLNYVVSDWPVLSSSSQSSSSVSSSSVSSSSISSSVSSSSVSSSAACPLESEGETFVPVLIEEFTLTGGSKDNLDSEVSIHTSLNQVSLVGNTAYEMLRSQDMYCEWNQTTQIWDTHTNQEGSVWDSSEVSVWTQLLTDIEYPAGGYAGYDWFRFLDDTTGLSGQPVSSANTGIETSAGSGMFVKWYGTALRYDSVEVPQGTSIGVTGYGDLSTSLDSAELFSSLVGSWSEETDHRYDYTIQMIRIVYGPEGSAVPTRHPEQSQQNHFASTSQRLNSPTYDMHMDDNGVVFTANLQNGTPLQLFTLTGRYLGSAEFQNNQARLFAWQLTPGVYFVRTPTFTARFVYR